MIEADQKDSACKCMRQTIKNLLMYIMLGGMSSEVLDAD